MGSEWARHGLTIALLAYIGGYITHLLQVRGGRKRNTALRNTTLEALHTFMKEQASMVEGTKHGNQDGG